MATIDQRKKVMDRAARRKHATYRAIPGQNKRALDDARQIANLHRNIMMDRRGANIPLRDDFPRNLTEALLRKRAGSGGDVAGVTREAASSQRRIAAATSSGRSNAALPIAKATTKPAARRGGGILRAVRRRFF